MDLTWSNIANYENGGDFKTIFHNYDLYVIKQERNLLELCDILGANYFIHETCLDEVVELFNEMALSPYSKNLADFYSFIVYFFKKQLYNKLIERDKAVEVYKKYIENIPYSGVDSRNKSTTLYRENEFIGKLIFYKTASDEDQNYVHSTLLKYLKTLNL